MLKKIEDFMIDFASCDPVMDDDDIPEFSDSDLKGFAPAYPEYFKITPFENSISINLEDN